MTNPIYPDKTKTGLAALKPLLVAFCDEPERWEWEYNESTDDRGSDWQAYQIDVLLACVRVGNGRISRIRLTPKPRRVWIGDQSYPEPLESIDEDETCWFADVSQGVVVDVDYSEMFLQALSEGFLFASRDHAQQCLDAHRRARRVE